MRILLDECIDERFRHEFAGHDCQTARFAKLSGLKNGKLLSAPEKAGFEVFITMDKGIPYQQNTGLRRLAIFVLRAPSNRLKDLIPIMPEVLALLPTTVPGEVQILPLAVGDRKPAN